MDVANLLSVKGKSINMTSNIVCSANVSPRLPRAIGFM